MLITRHSLLDRLWHKFCFTAYILYISHIVGLLGIYTNYLLLYYLLKYGNVQNKLFTWSVGVSLLLHFSHYFFWGKKLDLTIFTWDWLAGLSKQTRTDPCTISTYTTCGNSPKIIQFLVGEKSR